MKNILNAWAESLTMVRPSNLIMLCTLTLIAYWNTMVTLIRNLWWLIVGIFFLFIWYPHWIVVVLFSIGEFLGLVLASRPSVQRKDLRYFGGYLAHGFPLLILFFIPCCLHPLVITWTAPLLLLSMFFVCDARLRFKDQGRALVNAAGMVLNNLPLYLALVGLWYALQSLPVPTLLYALVLVPLYVVLISRCYVIWLHKDYQGYYEVCR